MPSCGNVVWDWKNYLLILYFMSVYLWPSNLLFSDLMGLAKKLDFHLKCTIFGTVLDYGQLMTMLFKSEFLLP